ncbi:cation-translocating P-type ATPase [Enhydrobacter aerosaccus]|uniref:cation-translocating P-type ATPase n=1 Tax=Enhydrobacter aerosaccus TaxID=225324 RepID=UPI0011164845|nr:cation-translocating P-type ATPase [Enhydrobacter aerosaccus]
MHQGLDPEEARQRLRREGPNELPSAGRRTPLHIAAEVLREPMFALLLGAAVIYLILGDVLEGIILLLFASLSVTISVVQETRSERVLETLRAMTSPRALVIRGGQRVRIPGRDVVRGDLVIVAEGDRVPADALLLTANDLLVDESLLTGESVPVRKRALQSGEQAPAIPGGDDQPTVFSGSLVVRGVATAEVFATGAHTEIGRIGKALATIDPATPGLKAQTTQLVQAFALLGFTATFVTVIVYGLLRGSWLEACLAGIALGMSMLPEEFPLVLTVFMTMGAWRISRARVLTRRSAAIETLGSATVLCTDKTGTLTENRMSVVALATPDLVMDWKGTGLPPTAELQRLLRYGALASSPEGFDPMDRAIRSADATSPDNAELVRSYGLTTGLLAVTQVWRHSGREFVTVAAKGAPEAIAGLCRLDQSAAAEIRSTVESLAAKGIRVLAVAGAEWDNAAALPERPQDFPFSWIGLIGLADPLRESVPEAMAQCRTAGIRVIMITGDYPVTAQAIGRMAGLNDAVVATGSEIAGLTDEELAQRVKHVDIFARILPEQKLRIVKALQSRGEVVAMTGDGVNDAPSLKAADIGIAMGGRGTDVAREASSIVLLDDDFGSIVRTIRLGRRIYDNLRKAMAYIVAVHLPIAGLAMLPLFTGLPLVLHPLHIAFIEMIIDPACSIVFEAEAAEPDLMRRPPRSPTARLFSTAMISWSVIQGLLAFATVAGVYLLAARRGLPAEDIRALSFFALILANIGLILINRSRRGLSVDFLTGRSPVLAGIVTFTLALLALSVSWQPARALFGFGPLHGDDIGMIVAAILAFLLVLLPLKLLARRLGAV